jgi:hypothetical protein
MSTAIISAPTSTLALALPTQSNDFDCSGAQTASYIAAQLRAMSVAGERSADALGNVIEAAVLLCVARNIRTADAATTLVTAIFDASRAATVAALAPADRKAFDATTRASRKAAPAALAPAVYGAHKDIENAYTYGPRVSRVVEALASVPTFSATFATFLARNEKSGKRNMSAGDLIDAARAALKSPTAPKNVDAAAPGEPSEGASAAPSVTLDDARPLTREQIVDNAVAQLRAIGDDAAADAILAAIANVAPVQTGADVGTTLATV